MDGQSCVKKAYDYILNSDFEQAIYWFEQAIAAEPLNASYHHKMAVSCARSGKWSKAHHYAEQAVSLDDSHVEYQYYLQTIEAKLLIASAEQMLAAELPRYADALPLLKQAAELDSLSFEARYLLALVYTKISQLNEAVASAREAVRLDPGHSAARRLYADLLRQRRILRYRTIGRQRKRNR